jgi:hypothetical protein
MDLQELHQIQKLGMEQVGQNVAAPLNTSRYWGGAAGTNTAALTFGGYLSPPLNGRAETELWNGTSWRVANAMNTARYILAGAGTNAAALAFGGLTSVEVNNTESWNGTSWTSVNDLNSARSDLGGSGTNTVALAFGEMMV